VKRLFAWSRVLGRWLAEARLFGIALLVLLGPLYVSFRPGTSEVQVRVSGLFLQSFGVATVAFGLHRIRKMFGRPSLVTSLKAWLSRLPRWIRKAVMAADTASISASGSITVESQWSIFDPDSLIEAQVGELAKNVERLKVGLIAVKKDIDSRAREQADALQREQQLRAEHDEKLQALLEAAETGGLHISFVGVIWLLFGLLLSSVPREIAQLLQ